MTETSRACLVDIGPGDGYPGIPHAPGVPPLADADRRRHAPDSHSLLVGESGLITARCSCWWTTVPSMHGEKVGFIGHFAAEDKAAASLVLNHACARLEAAGCTRAVGPIDGSTWRAYRAVVEWGAEPPFFLEPWNSAESLGHWTAAGFAAIAHYASAITNDLGVEDGRIATASARLERERIVIRPLNASDPESDLERILALSLESFSRNFLYGPVDQAEFFEQTRLLLPCVRPELVLLAEREGLHAELCGFLFAVPDILQARRGLPIDTVIIKTVAVVPRSFAAGLGSVLVARAHRVAHQLGYRRAIHALMHEANVSRNISRRYASTMRRYALLGKAL